MRLTFLSVLVHRHEYSAGMRGLADNRSVAPHELSIVIPVLDDTEPLRRLLATVPADPRVDILVINGGAPDDRLNAICGRPDVQLLTSAPGRGRQMNAGASAAAGRWIVFLHADTRLPPRWSDEIRRASADPAVVGGSFRFRLDSAAWQARLIERAVARRVHWLDLAYGDQALFVRRDVFDALGGYREWPLMEDVDFVRRLRRAGRLYHSAQPVLTSARRWERDGWWRRSAKNVMLQSLFFAGVSPERLATWYSHPPRRSTRDALVVMARVPSDDRGKSRLTRDLGGDHGGLRRALLLDTLDAVRGISDADLFVACEPAGAIAEMRGLLGEGARMFPQEGDTLGDRMRNAFGHLFAAGYSTVVMVGSDIPSLPAAHVAQAFQYLRDRPDGLVIGPAADGGYYLIGLRRPCPALFTSIAWSTADVLAATTSVAEKSGLTLSLVPSWHDVDTVDDLRRVLRDAHGATHTRAWVAAHGDLAVRDSGR
jgi:rSAM/selenodomain-associated transferase 2/rSAM/selenodomain-associated transferase 1